MFCFQEALANCLPYDMLDPYGDMPLAGGMEASVEIDIVDDGANVHIKSVKTPPRNGKVRLSEVLQGIMGPQMASPCVVDQGKCKEDKLPEKAPGSEKSGHRGQFGRDEDKKKEEGDS